MSREHQEPDQSEVVKLSISHNMRNLFCVSVFLGEGGKGSFEAFHSVQANYYRPPKGVNGWPLPVYEANARGFGVYCMYLGSRLELYRNKGSRAEWV